MFAKFKSIMRENRNIIIVFAATCFVPMIIIHILFKCHSANEWLIAEWSAGEVLGYVGSILSGLFTIVGVWFTVKASNKQYIEAQKDNVKPYISFCDNSYTKKDNARNVRCITAIVDENAQSRFVYEDYHLDKATAEKITKYIGTNGAILYIYDDRMKCIVFHMKNIGKGVAKLFRISDSQYSSLQTDLAVDDELKFVVYLRDKDYRHLSYTVFYENLYDDKFMVKIDVVQESDGYKIDINRK